MSKVKEDYNWNAILWGAVPVSILLALVYYFNFSKGLRNIYLIVGLIASMVITYFLDKKKQNIFTSPFIVLVVASIVYGLRILNLI